MFFFMGTAISSAKCLKRWWARQGLNLRPHPCEGDWRNRLTVLLSHAKTGSPKWPCTRFVRRRLVYRTAARNEPVGKATIAKFSGRVLGKRPWLDDGPAPPLRHQKTAGRAATLRSGSMNSCAAIIESYRFCDSCASAVWAGGGA